MRFTDYLPLFAQDERQVALVELKALEMKHKELQVLFSVGS